MKMMFLFLKNKKAKEGAPMDAFVPINQHDHILRMRNDPAHARLEKFSNVVAARKDTVQRDRKGVRYGLLRRIRDAKILFLRDCCD